MDDVPRDLFLFIMFHESEGFLLIKFFPDKVFEVLFEIMVQV